MPVELVSVRVALMCEGELHLPAIIRMVNATRNIVCQEQVWTPEDEALPTLFTMSKETFPYVHTECDLATVSLYCFGTSVSGMPSRLSEMQETSLDRDVFGVDEIFSLLALGRELSEALEPPGTLDDHELRVINFVTAYRVEPGNEDNDFAAKIKRLGRLDLEREWSGRLKILKG